MSLYAQIQQDYVAAMKAKEMTKKDILNYVFAQLKNKQIDLMRPITDDEVMQTIKKEIKTRQESIGFAEKAGKLDDAKLEQEKINILLHYLPAQLSEDALRQIVTAKITELQITDLTKQKWVLIWAIMQAYGSQVDGSLLQRILSSL